jgi:SpoIID/LytB domain protein
MRRLLLTGLLLLLLAPAAGAATRYVVRGGGYGHGIGMSQYGAYGYAKHGRNYREILGHYYTGTSISTASTRKVRVLLQSGDPYVRFRGATRLAGVRNLDRRVTYRVEPTGGRLALFGKHRLIGRYRMLRVYRKGGVLRLLGDTLNGVRSGLFHGALDIRPGSGGVTAINRIDLDQYVLGVVAGEMPSSWDLEALKVQAVAARTYALATRQTSGYYDLYPDTRSQVYQGVAGETPSTNRAVRATARQVVTYRGEPVVTYYFSTSGGRTENIENSFLGSEPKPWLKSVGDPYDELSPRHRWRFRFTTSQMDSKLGGYSPGTFEKIRVLRRGESPRIIRARVYGSGGTRVISGPTLRSRLGLYDTWAYFTRVSTSQVRSSRAPLGGAAAQRGKLGLARAFSGARLLRGVVDPRPRHGRLRLERRVHGRWLLVRVLRTDPGGGYRVRVRRPGRYRVRAGPVAGPAVRVNSRPR